MVVSLLRQTCWTAADCAWCEKLATTFSVTASVVNYSYFAVISDRHLGIYASLDNWRTCLFVCNIFVTDYLRRGLVQGDEIWQDVRPGWAAGHLSCWGTLAQGLAPRPKSEKNLVTHIS